MISVLSIAGIPAGIFFGFFAMSEVVTGANSIWGLWTALSFMGAGICARQAFSDAGSEDRK